jgi:hypothetical protein
MVMGLARAGSFVVFYLKGPEYQVSRDRIGSGDKPPGGVYEPAPSYRVVSEKAPLR